MSGRNRGGVTHCQASLHSLRALGGYGGEMFMTTIRATIDGDMSACTACIAAAAPVSKTRSDENMRRRRGRMMMKERGGEKVLIKGGKE